MTAETIGHIRAGALFALRGQGLPSEAMEDIVQETLARAIRYGEVPRPFYLGLTIARRLVIDRWRDDQRLIPDEVPDGWSPLWPQEVVVQLRQAMEALPDQHRAAVEDLIHGETHPTSAAYKRRHRALAALREAA